VNKLGKDLNLHCAVKTHYTLNNTTVEALKQNQFGENQFDAVRNKFILLYVLFNV
jgi:hypothetical protein